MNACPTGPDPAGAAGSNGAVGRPAASGAPGADRRAPPLAALGPDPLRETLLGARLDLAEVLSSAIAAEQLGPRAYLRWIAAERALCATGAASLRRMATRLGDAARPLLDGAAETLAEQAAMAAADLRRTDGMVGGNGLVSVDHWRDYHDIHAGRRPGLALGLVALHAGVAGGPARGSLSAVLELPFLPLRGATYLVHRQLQAATQADTFAGLWSRVPAEVQDDLLAGARHGAGLYCGVVRAALAMPADVQGWRWSDRRRDGGA